MKTATGILIVSLLAIESFAVDFLLVRDGRNVWVRDSDPFAYESRVARLNGAESIADETGTYCLYEGVKYYDIDAEAEAAASLPLQSATGFAVQDSDGHWVELEPTGDGLPVIGIQISNSPLTPEERAAMKAERKAAHDALKAAAQDKKLNDKAKVALLMKAVFGVEE